MNQLNIDDVKQYVNENIGKFHTKKIQSLDRLKLLDVLKRKNPYLYKAKNVLTSEAIVKGIVDAHISSNEETIFGDWLEELSIFINRNVFNGWKSGIPGIDLEFNNEHVRYIVNIKSGPNWGNKSQIEKMQSDFLSAKRTLRTSNSNIHVVAVNGCCYGRCVKPDRGDYFKYCGQKFWAFISGDDNLYIDIIDPIGYNARIRNDEYNELYSRKINLFTSEFSRLFCKENGDIDWTKILKFSSSLQGTRFQR